MTSIAQLDLEQTYPGFGPPIRHTTKLKPFRGHNHCPVCESHDGRCRGGEEIVLCMSETQDIGILNGYQFRRLSKDYLWGIWAPHTGEDFNPIDWETRKAIRDNQAEEERRQRIARELPVAQRDQQYRQLLCGLSLSSLDLADFQRRGMSSEEISGFKAVSVGQFQRVKDLSPDLPGILPGGILNSQSGYFGLSIMSTVKWWRCNSESAMSVKTTAISGCPVPPNAIQRAMVPTSTVNYH